MEAVIFDMDGVLCAYDFPARLAHLERRIGVPAETIDEAIFRSGFEDAADRGEMDEAAYLSGLSARLGTPVTRADWLAARAAAMTPNRDVLDLARSLAARLPVAVLTNNGYFLKSALPDLFPQVGEIFADHVYISAALGLAKPDPAAFRAVAARLGVAPARTFFTDDSATYIEGARAAGLTTHLFQNAATLRHALVAVGLD